MHKVQFKGSGNKSFILRGGRVIDPVQGIDKEKDVAVVDGCIVDRLPDTEAEIVDVSDKIVAPGFIDMHVHLRDPGQAHKETLYTGSRAAAAGGFTSILAMPNTLPPVDTPARLYDLRERFTSEAVVKILPAGTLTIERDGHRVTEMSSLKHAGAVAVTDDGTTPQETSLMRKAVAQAANASLPVLDHCEIQISKETQGDRFHTSNSDAASLCEADGVARDVVLAEHVDASIHVQHVSRRMSVNEIRQAQRRGVRITAEATPHHLALTKEAESTSGTYAKMNPPLGNTADRYAVREAIRDGTISAIATDHAPHAPEEKSGAFREAPPGVTGLETALPVCLTELVHKEKILTLPAFIAKFTRGPREILGLSEGTLLPGSSADITILDPETSHVIDPENFHSAADNTPFAGWHCRGKVFAAIVEGQCAYSKADDFYQVVNGCQS